MDLGRPPGKYLPIPSRESIGGGVGSRHPIPHQPQSDSNSGMPSSDDDSSPPPPSKVTSEPEAATIQNTSSHSRTILAQGQLPSNICVPAYMVNLQRHPGVSQHDYDEQQNNMQHPEYGRQSTFTQQDAYVGQNRQQGPCNQQEYYQQVVYNTPKDCAIPSEIKTPETKLQRTVQKSQTKQHAKLTTSSTTTGRPEWKIVSRSACKPLSHYPESFKPLPVVPRASAGRHGETQVSRNESQISAHTSQISCAHSNKGGAKSISANQTRRSSQVSNNMPHQQVSYSTAHLGRSLDDGGPSYRPTTSSDNMQFSKEGIRSGGPVKRSSERVNVDRSSAAEEISKTPQSLPGPVHFQDENVRFEAKSSVYETEIHMQNKPSSERIHEQCANLMKRLTAELSVKDISASDQLCVRLSLGEKLTLNGRKKSFTICEPGYRVSAEQAQEDGQDQEIYGTPLATSPRVSVPKEAVKPKVSIRETNTVEECDCDGKNISEKAGEAPKRVIPSRATAAMVSSSRDETSISLKQTPLPSLNEDVSSLQDKSVSPKRAEVRLPQKEKPATPKNAGVTLPRDERPMPLESSGTPFSQFQKAESPSSAKVTLLQEDIVAPRKSAEVMSLQENIPVQPSVEEIMPPMTTQTMDSPFEQIYPSYPQPVVSSKTMQPSLNRTVHTTSRESKEKPESESAEVHLERKRSSRIKMKTVENEALNTEFLYYSSAIKSLLPELSCPEDRRRLVPWVKKLFSPEYCARLLRDKRNRFLLHLTVDLCNDELIGVFRKPPPQGTIPSVDELCATSYPPAAWECDSAWLDHLEEIPPGVARMLCPWHIYGCPKNTEENATNTSDTDYCSENCNPWRQYGTSSEVSIGWSLDQEFKLLLYSSRPLKPLMRASKQRLRMVSWLRYLCTVTPDCCVALRLLRNDYTKLLLAYGQDDRMTGPFANDPVWGQALPPLGGELDSGYARPFADPASGDVDEFLRSAPIPNEGAFCYMAIEGVPVTPITRPTASASLLER